MERTTEKRFVECVARLVAVLAGGGGERSRASSQENLDILFSRFYMAFYLSIKINAV